MNIGKQGPILLTQLPHLAADVPIPARVLLVEQMREVLVQVLQEALQGRLWQLQLLEWGDCLPRIVTPAVDEGLYLYFFLRPEFREHRVVLFLHDGLVY